MPVTVSSFIDLANSGFYNGLHFHRVIPNFMDQCAAHRPAGLCSPAASCRTVPTGSRVSLASPPPRCMHP
eukprot:5901546-Prymnesium_polylepis.1